MILTFAFRALKEWRADRRAQRHIAQDIDRLDETEEEMKIKML